MSTTMNDIIEPDPGEFLESLGRLTRDIREAAKLLSPQEARFLVDAYYTAQDDRIRAAHQMRALAQDNEPRTIMNWLANQREVLEGQVKRALDAYSDGHEVGRWARSIHGIGPVIAAGLLAHIDIKQAPTAGHVWRIAGLDPTSLWLGTVKATELVDAALAKHGPKVNDDVIGAVATGLAIGTERFFNRFEKTPTRANLIAAAAKRPWNAALKRLCFLIGESFVKVSGNDKAYYGVIYKHRKLYENQRNDALAYADQARTALSTRRYGDDTTARKFYEQGKLPPARIHRRACRYATKWFLADLQCVWWWHETKTPPAMPYSISHMGHTDYSVPPNLGAFPGLEKALVKSKYGR